MSLVITRNLSEKHGGEAVRDSLSMICGGTMRARNLEAAPVALTQPAVYQIPHSTYLRDGAARQGMAGLG